MRGHKVYTGMALITFFTIGYLLLSIQPTNATKHPSYCPPWCFMTYGTVESATQTSAPLGPGAPAIAVSDPQSSKEKGASKNYGYVYAPDNVTKVKVSMGHEVYEIFKGTKKLVGFSVMANRKKIKKDDPDKEEVPELIAFVPAIPSEPAQAPGAEDALRKYMEAFQACAKAKNCGGEESKAQH